MLERLFRLSELRTSARTEVLAGVTTFVTMAYIVVVNPAILSNAGMPVGPSTVATILVAVLGCLLMAFFANRPFAVAPYMGENAFVAFGLTALGISWQIRLGIVFLAGLLFFVLSVANVRTWLVEAIPLSLKHSFSVGIGLFLAFIGLYDTGIVTSGSAGMPPAALTDHGFLRPSDVPVKLGNFHDPKVLLAVFGFIVIVALMSRKVKGSILIGMVITGVLGGLLGFAQAPKGFFAVPFTGDLTLGPVFMQLDLRGALDPKLLPIVLTLLIMPFLDTTGTLVGLGAAADLLDEQGNLPHVQKPMMVDALSCIFAPVIGTSTSGVFVESAAGIKEGARSGLSTLVVGLLFAVSIFFIPLIEPLQALKFAYGPALVAVGVMMLPSVRKIDFEDYTESVPAFLAIVMTIFTYNIANGLSAGLAAYPIIKLLSGRVKDVKPGAWILGALCLSYYVLGVSH